MSRDVYCSFWTDALDSYFIGADQRVPLIRHDLYVDEWTTIAKILVKGYLDTGYFPITINKCFIKYCLFGEVGDDEIIDGFLNYVSMDERKLLKQVMEIAAMGDQDNDIFKSDDIFELLEDYKCRRLLTARNAREIICEIARQELHQKPHLIVSCWGIIFNVLKKDFPSNNELDQIYEKLVPTNKKVLALLKVDSDNESERDSFNFLKRYIKGLDETGIRNFLRFTTGSESIIVDSITISFIISTTTFQRRPIAHTCGPMLELPIYTNLGEMREDFSKILSLSRWEMDIV